MLQKLALGALAVFAVIQLVPYGRDHANPPVLSEPRWNSPETRATFERACANCHSHQTRWPWYSHVAPMSWLVQYDVDEARSNFNVSRWGTGHNEGDEAAEMVSEDRMPPKIYLVAHKEARLDAEERRRFATGLDATFGEGTAGHPEGEVGEKSGYID